MLLLLQSPHGHCQCSCCSSLAMHESTAHRQAAGARQLAARQPAHPPRAAAPTMLFDSVQKRMNVSSSELDTMPLSSRVLLHPPRRHRMGRGQVSTGTSTQHTSHHH